MTKRAYLTFSSKKHYVDELKQQEYVFETYSNLPKWLIDQLLSEVQLEHSNIRSLTQDKQNDVNKTAHLLVLPYAGLKDEKLIKSMKNCLKCVLPENVATTVTYSGTRLSSEFTMIKYETVNMRIIMILSIMLNVQKVSAQKTMPEKQHGSCQKEYLTIIVEVLNLIW